MDDLPVLVESERKSARLRGAFSLIELLCVMAIIGILVGLMLGPIGRAFRKARGFKAEVETPAHVERLTDGMRKFAAAHTAWSCPDLEALLTFAKPGGPTERWIKGAHATLVPFRHDTPPETLVLNLQVPGGGSGKFVRYSFTKGDLTITPE